MNKKYILSKKIESAAYASSLIQQNMGESLEKGYLIWDIETCTHERRFILNDYGFCKLNISKGEDIWERLDTSIKLSFNPKKTKVYIEIEDDKENENIELKGQIKKYVKNKYKCESVEVEYKKITKNNTLGANTDSLDISNEQAWRALLVQYLNENNFDNIQDVLELNDEIDRALNLKQAPLNYLQWDLNKMITFNIFSHPAKETVFDFDTMEGLTGIFGKNGNGKSNIIKALVWGLYEKILGGGESHKVINMYTGINKAWVEIYFTAAGMKFKSRRQITVTLKKDGTTKAAYLPSYEYAIMEDDGVTIKSWEPAESDRAAKEKPEIKKLIVDAIGTFENFTKVSLQTQGGKDDYLSLSQQPKNDLMREYNNLGPCDLRHEFGNKKFNAIKNLQKQLGDPAEIEANINEVKLKIEEEKQNILSYQKDKDDNNEQIDVHNDEILKLAEQKVKIDVPSNLTVADINLSIEKESAHKGKVDEEIYELDMWLKTRYKKEIPEGLEKLTTEQLTVDLETEKVFFNAEKEAYSKADEYLKSNEKQTELSIDESEKLIDSLKSHAIHLSNDLKISKGEKCPTCGNITAVANEEEEKKCLQLIEENNKKISDAQKFINDQREIIKKNLLIDKAINRFESIKNNLRGSKLKIDELKLKIEQVSKIQDDIDHNKQVVEKTNKLQLLRNQSEEKKKIIEKYQSQMDLLVSSHDAITKNEEIDIKIKEYQESIKQYKLLLVQLDNKLRQAFSNVSVQEGNMENMSEKLTQIRESVRIYQKYSIYLQAVSRDGIPAQIIRKRLPMINYKINNILNSIVGFKIEISIKSNGDVYEVFFFNDDKSDALPFSMASGSQKFIGAVAIREALHYVSCLIKPSFCIIDEGFDTLDTDKIAEVGPVLSYLKNKHRNVILVTHRNEIKDYVDHIIQVQKSNVGLDPQITNSNPEAGISLINIT